jgi:lactoylglutathione lyase
MSANVHIHLHVASLAKSRDFYVKFFGEPPVKEKPGYLKFLPALAPLNMALSETKGEPSRGVESHFGVQVENSDIVRKHLERVKAAGLPVHEEMNVNCCHANQDKFWVKDPDGVEWEVYHLNYDLNDAQQAASQPTTCCSR